MTCSRCQKNEAQVHYKSVVNGEESSADLCANCAREAGFAFAGAGAVSFPALSPALNELFGLLSSWPARPAAAAIARNCPACKWTLERFQKTGLMGCPECYVQFRAQARGIVQRIHGSSAHKGRLPSGRGAERTKGREKIASPPELRGRLEAAIRQERFEEAAVLRDMLRKMEAGE